ncbi:MAG: hypothetical protein ACREGA_04200 [Candidatus Saccharimonadales bacterium]
MIKTTQKIIGIGASDGVTIPKKDLKKLGAKRGDELQISVTLASKPNQTKHDKLMKDYDSFVKQYGATLKNLADR